jgi:photosystem II stability/assembly factor-like uncharacterized protein
MKKIITFLFFLSLFSSNICYSQSGWYNLNSGTSNDLKAICFTNVNTGWCAGGDQILKTTNGGNNWSIQFITGANIQSMSFVNQNTGYLCGYAVHKTTNGGINWEQLNLTVYSGYMSVFFLDSNIGFVGGAASGGDGICAKTTNGGKNWVYYITDCYVVTMFFINSNVGFAGNSANPGAEILVSKTTNSGVNWEYNTGWGYINGGAVPSIFFINQSTGFLAGYYNNARIRKTITTGSSWTTKFEAQGRLYSIHFTNQNVGYSIGRDSSYPSSMIVKTTNGGENWFKQSCPNQSTLQSVFFINENVGYACGYGGTIIKTTDGGGPPLSVESGKETTPTSPSLSQNYPNPFNPVTKIKYDIPPSKGARGMMVKLIIYDILGREIETLVNESKKPGSYEVNWDGSRYASGVYFYRLITDDYVETKKMVLIK